MPCCEISDCAQMSKTIIAVRHFGLGGRESLETAVKVYTATNIANLLQVINFIKLTYTGLLQLVNKLQHNLLRNRGLNMSI